MPQDDVYVRRSEVMYGPLQLVRLKKSDAARGEMNRRAPHR